MKFSLKYLLLVPVLFTCAMWGMKNRKSSNNAPVYSNNVIDSEMIALVGDARKLLQFIKLINENEDDKKLDIIDAQFFCDSCDKICSSYRSLLKHQRTIHNTKFEHQCDLCDKSYTTKRALSGHIKAKHSTN